MRNTSDMITTQVPVIIEQAAAAATARIVAAEAVLKQLKVSVTKHANYLDALHATRP